MEMARRMVTVPHTQVTGLILFDSPLIRPAPATAANKGIGTPDLDGAPAEHFAACHVILDAYYEQNGALGEGRMRLNCPVVHVVPENGSCAPDKSVLDEITSASASLVTGPGDHWTMLYGENALVAASAVSGLL